MTPTFGGRLRVLRWGVVALLAAVCPGVSSSGAVAQETVASIVADRQLEYDAAEADYLAALQAVRVLERQWDQAVGGAERARRSGNTQAREEALARAQELTLPLQSGEQRVRDTRESWMEAARALASALDARLDLLAAEIQRTDTDDGREELATLWRDTRNRLVSVEDVLSEAQAFELRPLPEITTDARDGPEDILIKAELLDRRAREYDLLVREVNQEIESLQRRVRRNRVIDDFLSGLERFDDTRMPVTPESQRTAMDDAETQEADSTAAGDPSSWSLEYRIQQLTILRDEMESRRDRVEEKAELFRRLATSGGRS